MPNVETKSIQFRTSDGDKTTDATLDIILFDQGDRVKRALKFLILSWLAAGITLFIPLAHFVLVPGFFLLGIYLAFSASKTLQAMDSAKGSCPVCSESITIKLEPKDTLPKWTYCPTCNNSLQLREQ